MSKLTTKARTSRDAQAAASRQAILDAALLLFAEHGFAATSTRRIARDAGVSEGLIFHHFPTKQQLLLGIVQTAATLPHAVADLLASGDSMPVEICARSLASSFVTLLRPGRPEAQLFRVILAESQHNAELHALLGGVQLSVVGGLSRYLSVRIDAGELRRDLDPNVAARCLLGSLISYFLMNRRQSAATWEREATPFAQAAVDFWLVGARMNTRLRRSSRSEES